MAILRSCRAVNAEAKPIIARVTQERILDHPPRVLASFYGGWNQLHNFLRCVCAEGQRLRSDAGEALRGDIIVSSSDGGYVLTLGKQFDITAEILQFAQQGARAILNKDDSEVEVVFFRPTMDEDDKDEGKEEDDELEMFFYTLFEAGSCNAL
jgi:hypothetical protein